MMVDRQFLVTPLLEWIGQQSHYYVLAVSVNRVRLYEGDAEGLTEVDVPGLPENQQTALNYDTPESVVQAHSGQTQIRGKEGRVFHGQGGAPDDVKDEIQSYFQIIDAAVAKYLRNQKVPLVFAGVDYEFAIYRRLNSYPHLAEQHVSGNTDYTSPSQLKAAAAKIVEAQWRNNVDGLIERYWNASARGLVANSISDIVGPAATGRVELLLVDPAATAMGKFDPVNQTVRIDEPARKDSEDLVNLAVLETLRHQGDVQAAPRANVPGGGAAAAVFRY
jgi:hypothetical protein